jgi:hypothetical protein
MKDSIHTLQLSAVPAEAIELVWQDVEPMLQKAIDASGGRYSTISILAALLRKELGLWVVLDYETPVAAITTRVAEYPNGRALALDWIGGARMREWLPLAHDVFSRYAKDHGCTELQGYGRRAWERWLRTYGWKPDYIAYKMDLSDG